MQQSLDSAAVARPLHPCFCNLRTKSEPLIPLLAGGGKQITQFFAQLWWICDSCCFALLAVPPSPVWGGTVPPVAVDLLLCTYNRGVTSGREVFRFHPMTRASDEKGWRLHAHGANPLTARERRTSGPDVSATDGPMGRESVGSGRSGGQTRRAQVFRLNHAAGSAHGRAIKLIGRSANQAHLIILAMYAGVRPRKAMPATLL